MAWPPSNTILSSVIKGDFSQALGRAKNYVTSGEILTDTTNVARLVASKGTDIGAWTNAGAKAVGGYNGAGDLTGGYGSYLNLGASAFDLGMGGAAKSAAALKSATGVQLLNYGDKAAKLLASSDGLSSLFNGGPRAAAAVNNNAQASSALASNAIGQPPSGGFPMTAYNPSAGGSAITGEQLEVSTKIPTWLILGGVAYFLFIKK